ncbi:MAG: tRNA uridine-5-carboxymethylaminomethyl(34) synthesis GTPase MnmE [Candidatus Velthaea sp.]
MRETIAAIATAPGKGAIAIVRCSGDDARRIAARVFRSSEPLRDRVATYGAIVDVEGNVIDRGLAIAMDAPRTVTGEDCVELHVHGSPVTARETLRALVHAGARLAGPGEFTRRAYLNGKLDLSAAEAVADLIDAESRAAAQAASANLAGGLRREVDGARADLASVLEELAGAIDYPDEVPEPELGDLTTRVVHVRDRLQALVHDWERGRVVREGLALAIVGPANAGKSSLLNALIGEERAIVSPVAGTTRDTIEESFAIDGVLVRIIDTAGLRASNDPIERAGIDRARKALAGASLALVVIDGSRSLDVDARAVLQVTSARPRVVFYNKRDLGTAGYDARENAAADDAINGSVFDSESLAALRSAIAVRGWHGEALDLTRPHLSSARQAGAVAGALDALAAALDTLARGQPADLIAGDLLTATAALAEITGGAATEALLDGIFARFCIGK